MIDVNLLPKSRRSTLARRRRSRAWMSGGAAYAMLLVIGGACFALSGPQAAVATDLYERQERELKDRSARVETLGSEITGLGKRLERLQRVQSHPDMSSLVRVVAAQLGGELVLDSIAMERQTIQPKDAGRARVGADAKPAAQPIGVYQIDISGLAKDQPDVTSFVLRLENLKLFDKVTVIESGKRDIKGAALTQFKVRCRVEQTPAKGGGA